jgi:hypothetical protein
LLFLSYYCLYSLFNKIRDKGRTISAGREGEWGEMEGVGERRRKGVRGRNDSNIVCTYE